MTEPIPTGCDSIDTLLGGGFERGTITQLYGPPASGKTNLTLAAAIHTAATNGTALYIDTEGLSPDRFEQLARNHTTPTTHDTDDSAAAVDAIAARVMISDVYTFEEQYDAVRDAETVADDTDLIVLDSATGFYRLERDDNDQGETLRTVAKQITHLLGLARRHDIAVVITNQVYADPDSDSSRPRPLGGHTLTHWSGVVIRLERFRGGNRRATLEKHHSQPAGTTARFQITETGITTTDDTTSNH